MVRRVRRNPSAVVGLSVLVLLATIALFSHAIAPGYAFATSAVDKLQGPSWAHPMGTDQLGRDLFTAVVQGARTSLRIVAGVVFISTIIGVTVGALSGLRGGLLDDVVMRVIEMVQTVPRFFLAILVVAWFGPSANTVIVLLGLTSWPLLARVVRAESLSLREREFVALARAAGASDLRVLVWHVLPNVLPSALVVVAVTASRVVLLEAGLAFLGLSDPNVPSWGALINNAQPYLARAWWMSVFPGIAIVVTVLAMNLVADGLNDVFSGLTSSSTSDDPVQVIATV
jgi:peptide/nickel transport system permease protein